MIFSYYKTLDIMDYYLGPLCKLRDWIPIEKLDWVKLSANPNAIHLLEQNLDKIDWPHLSTNPNAINLLEQNLHKINWNWLSVNSNAIPMLEQNKDKIDWYVLSSNPSIFVYDWVAMRNRLGLFKEELVAKQFHPKNIDKFVSWGFEEFEDLEF